MFEIDGFINFMESVEKELDREMSENEKDHAEKVFFYWRDRSSNHIPAHRVQNVVNGIRLGQVT